MVKKYIELEYVQSLVKIIDDRDMYMDWTDSYKERDLKLKELVRYIEDNAIPIKEFTPDREV